MEHIYDKTDQPSARYVQEHIVRTRMLKFKNYCKPK